MVCRLPEGVVVLLSPGVVVVLVLRESARTTRGFLTVWGLDDPAPSSVGAFRLTGCWGLVLLCSALFRTVIACFNFVNLLATLVFDTLASMNIASGFIVLGSTHVSLGVFGVEGLSELVHEHVDVLHGGVLENDVHVVP